MTTTLTDRRIWHDNFGHWPHRRLLTLHWTKADAWYRRDLPDGSYLTVSRAVDNGYGRRRGGWFWTHTDVSGFVTSSAGYGQWGVVSARLAQVAAEHAAGLSVTA